MTKNDPFLVKTMGKKKKRENMIQTASLGHFQTSGFLCPVSEFHNRAAHHVDSSARARWTTYPVSSNC